VETRVWCGFSFVCVSCDGYGDAGGVIGSLFFKQEMELSLIGLQNAGKTSLVNVITVCLCLCVFGPLALVLDHLPLIGRCDVF
jgi:energy-converting hydrogenase Eha subunit H